MEAEKDYTLLHSDITYFLQEKSAKPRFYEVVQMYDFAFPLQEVAAMGCVEEEIIEAMFSGDMVHRVHARSVLAGLSLVTGMTWTLDNVKIALKPSFQDFHALYQFESLLLSTTSGVSLETIGMMLRDKAVPMKEARSVLQAASQQTGQTYTFSNVDVQIVM